MPVSSATKESCALLSIKSCSLFIVAALSQPAEPRFCLDRTDDDIPVVAELS